MYNLSRNNNHYNIYSQGVIKQVYDEAMGIAAWGKEIYFHISNISSTSRVYSRQNGQQELNKTKMKQSLCSIHHISSPITIEADLSNIGKN